MVCLLRHTNSVWKIHMNTKAIPSTVYPKSTLCSLIYFFPPQCGLTCPSCRGSFPESRAGIHPPLAYHCTGCQAFSHPLLSVRDTVHSCADPAQRPHPHSFLPPSPAATSRTAPCQGTLLPPRFHRLQAPKYMFLESFTSISFSELESFRTWIQRLYFK